MDLRGFCFVGLEVGQAEIEALAEEIVFEWFDVLLVLGIANEIDAAGALS